MWPGLAKYTNPLNCPCPSDLLMCAVSLVCILRMLTEDIRCVRLFLLRLRWPLRPSKPWRLRSKIAMHSSASAVLDATFSCHGCVAIGTSGHTAQRLTSLQNHANAAGCLGNAGIASKRKQLPMHSTRLLMFSLANIPVLSLPVNPDSASALRSPPALPLLTTRLLFW